MITYNVVKFIVKVKLVENSVKSHVGRVIDTNVTSQYRTLGITFTPTRRKRPSGKPELLSPKLTTAEVELDIINM